MAESVDVLIIGGGPGGATAGLLLARAGWSVAIVERDAFPRGKVCGEFLSASNLPLLRQLNLADSFCRLAGPEVRRVAVFSEDAAVVADMPGLRGDATGWGRALGREHLDAILLSNAAAEGASVWQPWSAVALREDRGRFECDLVHRTGDSTRTLSSRLVIAAHGSWVNGKLPTLPARQAARASDLFGFKTHFSNADLPDDLMPLLAFSGGYGGMVHTDGGRISLSCCIRRDVLMRCRRRFGGNAGDAVCRYISSTCSPVRHVLRHAARDGSWQSTGPIRPGIRIGRVNGGVFLVGNAAGEAHPVVAEGIGMAMQSGWLVADTLIHRPHLVAGRGPLNPLSIHEASASYRRRWRQNFVPRIFASGVIAQWATRPSMVRLTLPLLRVLPALLTQAARTTGKVTPICSPSF
jgi:flavin-dependent dehydrogenase